MNILLFIVSMMMILSIVTYARFQTFLDHNVIQKEYLRFMQIEERKQFNEKQNSMYIRHKGNKLNIESIEAEPSKEIPEAGFSPIKRNNLNSKLNILSLLNESPLPETLKESSQTRIILLKLMDILYRNHPSFQHFYEMHHDLNELILHHLSTPSLHINTYSEELTTEKLRNIQLQDPQLQEAFYMMLKGTMTKEEAKKAKKIKLKLGKEKESLPDEGYRSLLDFIIISKNKKPISIYLASEPLLLAIYQDSNLVYSILEKRKEIYKAIEKEKITIEGGRMELERLFSRKHPANLDSTLFDFSVSKTVPE